MKIIDVLCARGVVDLKKLVIIVLLKLHFSVWILRLKVTIIEIVGLECGLCHVT